MTDKFNYLDILTCVLPGAYALTIAIGFWLTLHGSWKAAQPLLGTSGVFSSVVFVFMSFIVGNAMQAVAHGVPERLLRWFCWSGRWPSELALLRGGPCLTDPERSRVCEAAVRFSLLSEDDLALFDVSPQRRWCRWRLPSDERTQPALETAQSAFRGARSLLADLSAGVRVSTAEAYYLFFRATFVTSGVGTVAFLLLGVEASWKSAVGLPVDGIASAWAFAGLLAFGTALFFRRARGAGERFARETYLSLSVLAETKTMGPKGGASGGK